MNSKLLQNTFPKVYEKFFQQHELVFSCPFVTNRSGDILGNFAGIPVRQKIPLRMYIGISFGNNSFQLGDISYYDIASDQFLNESLSEYNASCLKFFNALIKDFEHAGGYRINILSECSKSLGLGFTSIFNILTVTSLSYATQQTSKQDLLNEKNGRINDALRKDNSLISNIFKKTTLYEIESGGEARLTPKIASFFDGKGPILAFREDNANEANQAHRSTSLYGFRMEELRPELDPFTKFPGDFVIFFTGKPLHKERVDDSHLEKIQFKTAKNTLLQVMQKHCGTLPDHNKPKFYKQLLEPDYDTLPGLYGQMMGSISIEIIHLLRMLFLDSSEQELHDLINSLNKFKFANNLTRVNSQEYLKLLDLIEYFFNSSNNNVAIFPIESTISGGCIGIVSAPEQIRHKISNLLLSCKETANDNVSIVYENYIDGYEEEGIRIDQDLSQNTQSAYLKKTKYKLINRDGSVHLKSYQEGITDTHNDIIVDLIKNKIHIGGQSCNSQVLHSQSATVELLCKLIEEKSSSITSKSLPVSSYTKNKSDMITKVITPLVKLIQEKLHRTIKIQCNGYISNYVIESDMGDIKIGLLKEI